MFGGGKKSSKATSARAPPRLNEEAINALFNEFADERVASGDDSKDKICFDGLTKLCEAVHLDISDIKGIVLAFKLCSTHTTEREPQCIMRSEFIQGMKNLNVDTIEGLAAQVPSFDPGFFETKEFKELYRFTFNFNRECKSHKTLDKEMVIGLLELILDSNRAPHLEYFIEFLNTACPSQKITLDQWDSFLQFQSTDIDCSNYDENGAWPLLLDEYVEWRKKQKK